MSDKPKDDSENSASAPPAPTLPPQAQPAYPVQIPPSQIPERKRSMMISLIS